MSNIYHFTLVLDGVDENTPLLEDAIFEAGCDDALINYKNGTVYLDFDREDKDFESAIISAINQVENAKIGATVVSVAPEHLVSLSDIAERLNLTRQSISLQMQGARGAGDFPKPVLKITNKSPLWRWVTVVDWFYKHGKLKEASLIEQACILEEVNTALELRNPATLNHTRRILTKFQKKSV